MRKKVFLITAILLFLLDRVSKTLWANADFAVIPQVLGFHAAKNTGMAFGMFSGGGVWLIALSAMAIAALLWALSRYTLTGLSQFGLGLLLGGAAGNLFDRVAYGYVIDFIDVLFLDFFVFNIADIGVTAGAAIVALTILLEKKDE